MTSRGHQSSTEAGSINTGVLTLGSPADSAGESARAVCKRKKPCSEAVARTTRRWPLNNLLRIRTYPKNS